MILENKHSYNFDVSHVIFLAATVTTMFSMGCGSNSSTPPTNLTPTLVSIAVTPATSSVTVASQQQFAAQGRYSDSSTKDLTNTATWSSSDTTVATITPGGLVTGVKAGNVKIGAVQNGINGSTALTVKPSG